MFLGTPADNMADKVSKNRQCHGEQRPLAKLTEQNIRDIRASQETHVALAERFGVSFQNIARIRAGRTWKHVD